MPDPAAANTPRPIHDPDATAATAWARYDAGKKSATIAYLIWFVSGMFGGHRFYLRRTGSGMAMLAAFAVSVPLSAIGVGLIGLIMLAVCSVSDAATIPEFVEEYNGRLLARLRA